MWSRNYMKCLSQGHVSAAFTFKGTEYQYCVRCGKIESTNHRSNENASSKSSSQHPAGESAGMWRMMSMSR